MADEHSQRPYRSSETIARAGQAKPAASGNDPLAELARLIGQSDPFGEFTRDAARRAASSPPASPQPAPVETAPAYQQPVYPAPSMAPAAPPPSYSTRDYSQDYYTAPAAQPASYDSQYSHQSYEPAGYAAPEMASPYAAHGASGYPPVGGYEPGNPPYAAPEHELYDDVQPSRRRTGVMVVAGVFALAVIGTAGAFGYRAVFGGSRSSAPPPVIKAETAPSKVVPAAPAKDAQANKQITDRVSGVQGEKVVSREETPVDRPPVVPDSQINQPAQGSGVVGSDPKKIRTIAIRPDQQGGMNAADVAPVAASTAPSASPLALMPDQPTRQVQTQRIPANAAAAPAAPAPVAAPAPQAAQAPANAPLSLNPNAAPRSSAAPVRTASVPPSTPAPAARSGGGQYGVQVSSQRSEAEAQAAYRALEAKFPSQLGGKPHFVYSVDLGAKGTYYRAMVGPFSSNEEASALCSGLKSAGATCIIQRN